MADNVPTMVLDDDLEAEYLPTTDYFFYRIGDPVRIKPSPFKFDPQNPPSQPLAVSERDGLIFVAHDSGFCIARTTDVIGLASRNPNNSSVWELGSIISDVNYFAPVRILALSYTDHIRVQNHILAVAVGGRVDFFYVYQERLTLGKLAALSLDDSSYVKDFRWKPKSDDYFLILSNLGKLYHGRVYSSLEHAMDNVDAVEWITEGSYSRGDYIVVAKEDNLSFLSYELEERSRMVLSFKSWIGDSDANCTVKVDSIRWVRRDSIIVGCFQLTEDGREENYLVQVIRSNDGKFSDASCKPIVISCPNLCSSINDNILSFGSGPYLLSSYLEQCELAIIANKKSTDQHISYLGWSLGKEKDEFAVIEIERDTCLPRIELQENDDENLILGMCIDKSFGERMTTYSWGQGLLERGTEVIEQREQLCNLICLTVEGKLVMFEVFRQRST